ncbi:MAG: DNA mismatch endonuclease Vsr [Hyphomonadaceae bacterium]|nr:DNA mismatch endonuclease Vsr [Hyphomonadaceae bacterium]
MRTDVFDEAKRSAVMRAVKSRDTGPELAVRAAVCALGYNRRYRLNGAKLPSKPDLVFGGMRKVIFVHGCFWHGHTCPRGSRQPKDNAAYWRAKIQRNRARDAASIAALRKAGWKTLVAWECETKAAATMARKLRAFLGEPTRRNNYRVPARSGQTPSAPPRAKSRPEER